MSFWVSLTPLNVFLGATEAPWIIKWYSRTPEESSKGGQSTYWTSQISSFWPFDVLGIEADIIDDHGRIRAGIQCRKSSVTSSDSHQIPYAKKVSQR
jgi:hypothetical protein